MTLVGCLTPDQFAAKIAAVLGIQASQVKDVTVTPPCSPTKRQGTVSSVTFTLEGENLQTADVLSSGMDIYPSIHLSIYLILLSLFLFIAMSIFLSFIVSSIHSTRCFLYRMPSFLYSPIHSDFLSI